MSQTPDPRDADEQALGRGGSAGRDLTTVPPEFRPACGRPGSHPLLRMVAPRLRLPLVPLAIRHGEQGRDLNAGRFAAGPADGADVLLLDDTWVSGASAQSAAVALKRAGAARVAVVVIGRYLNPAEPRSSALAIDPYDPGICVFQNR